MFYFDLIDIEMEIMPQAFVFEKKIYKAETNVSKMIKFGAKCLGMVAMRRSHCDQDIRQSLKSAKGSCLASKA